MKIELKFPVFAFQKNDNMIYTFFKERELKSTNTRIIQTFDYKNITIVDSDGNMFKINKAYKLKYIGLFGFSLIKKGRQILVDYEFDSDVRIIELSDFKADIIKRIEKKKSFWQSAWDIDELKSKIMNCNSFVDVAYLIK